MLGGQAVLRGLSPVMVGRCPVAAGAEAPSLGVGSGGTGTALLVDEIRPVLGGRVTVFSTHRPIRGGLCPVACVLWVSRAALLRRGVAFLSLAITALGPHIPLIRPPQPVRNPLFIRGSPVPRRSRRLAIALVGVAVPTVGLAIARVGLAVPKIGVAVPRIGDPVPFVGNASPLIPLAWSSRSAASAWFLSVPSARHGHHPRVRVARPSHRHAPDEPARAGAVNRTKPRHSG
jgi:hypothetical protein